MIGSCHDFALQQKRERMHGEQDELTLALFLP